MVHKATKNYAGNYTYRGYEINRMETSETKTSVVWHIRNHSEENAHDTEDTLSGAKKMIDRFIENAQASDQ